MPGPLAIGAPTAQPPGPVSDAAIGILRLERELQRALHQQEFVLFFQPIVHLCSRRLAGFEALIRWRHPERGLVSPGAFIPAAEAGGLIVELTAWCLAKVGRVLPEILGAALASPGLAERLFVSVNVSSHDLAQAGFSDRLRALLRTASIAPGALKIEVTESTLMQDPKRAGMALDACRALGVGIAIDDFGTGYSSLSYPELWSNRTSRKCDLCKGANIVIMKSEQQSRAVIEITPQMIEEGVRIFCGSGFLGDWDAPHWAVAELVRDLLRASLDAGAYQVIEHQEGCP